MSFSRYDEDGPPYALLHMELAALRITPRETTGFLLLFLFFVCFFSYFIAPHSYIPLGSGLGTRRLTLKYHFLKYSIHLVQYYLIVACIILR